MIRNKIANRSTHALHLITNYKSIRFYFYRRINYYLSFSHLQSHTRRLRSIFKYRINTCCRPTTQPSITLAVRHSLGPCFSFDFMDILWKSKDKPFNGHAKCHSARLKTSSSTSSTNHHPSRISIPQRHTRRHSVYLLIWISIPGSQIDNNISLKLNQRSLSSVGNSDDNAMNDDDCD